jgi:hypothetical protein
MTNSMSKPIPKKPEVQRAFAHPMIPLWPRATWVPDKANEAGEKTHSLKLTFCQQNQATSTAKHSPRLSRSSKPERPNNGLFGDKISRMHVLEHPL